MLPVFVYGSLRRSQRGHHVVEPYVVSAQTATARGRRVETAQWYPGVVFDGDELIDGELLYLDDSRYADALDRVDDYESAGRLYERVTVTASTPHGGVKAHAYSYLERA